MLKQRRAQSGNSQTCVGFPPLIPIAVAPRRSTPHADSTLPPRHAQTAAGSRTGVISQLLGPAAAAASQNMQVTPGTTKLQRASQTNWRQTILLVRRGGNILFVQLARGAPSVRLNRSGAPYMGPGAEQ